MSFSSPNTRGGAPRTLQVYSGASGGITKVPIQADAPPLQGPKSILSADLVTVNPTTGAASRIPLAVVTWATRNGTPPADEIFWVDHHTIALNRAIAAPDFIEMSYIPGQHGGKGKDQAAVDGTLAPA
jgi:hypothetical protein